MIGQYPQGDVSLNGTADELRISSVVRYTDGFDPCTALNFANDTNTVAYWKFDEGTGTTVTDFSGNGYNGTLQGSPLPAWVSGVTCGGSQQMLSLRSGGSRLGGVGMSRSQLSGRSTTTLTNSPVSGSSVTITDTLGRIWGLLPHP